MHLGHRVLRAQSEVVGGEHADHPGHVDGAAHIDRHDVRVGHLGPDEHDVHRIGEVRPRQVEVVHVVGGAEQQLGVFCAQDASTEDGAGHEGNLTVGSVRCMADVALFDFEHTYARDLEGLYQPWQASVVPSPQLLVLNRSLAAELGVDADALATPEGVAVLAGNQVPSGASPLAQAYAGHQFGGYSPRLGDGRALLLGEVIDTGGRRRDIQLKGSGRTPFARGGDGKAAVAPMLREYVMGEAMHALGIPTTRALAVVATGEMIRREIPLPGAVLTRVAASHLRVGTFQFAAATGDADLLRRLVDHAIARHAPAAADARNPALALLAHVVEVQAALVARWMHVGFIHGVMNTDNTTISGETIDYGPCAFMDVEDPATVFSSIDHGGRYAYGNQPRIAQWNLARLAESLLPLIDADVDAAIPVATDELQRFTERFDAHWIEGMRRKTGVSADGDADGDVVVRGVPDLLHAQRVDHTRFYRSLSAVLRGDAEPARSLFADPDAFDRWAARWRPLVAADAEALDRVNPVYIARNHLVEEALAAATEGDMAPFDALLAVLERPFDERPGLERYALGAPTDFGPYQTFCGT